MNYLNVEWDTLDWAYRKIKADWYSLDGLQKKTVREMDTSQKLSHSLALRITVLVIKFNKKCKEVRQKIRSMRANKLKDIISKLNQILVGYYHYYGITDNGRSLSAFRYQVMRSLHYWLNRRSQKKSYTWSGFLEMIDTAYPLARAKIYVSIYG